MNDLMQFQHFHLLRPYWLIAMFISWYLINSFAKRDDAISMWRSIMSKEMIEYLSVNGNSNNWISPNKVGKFCIVLICIVLSGPTWQQQPSPLTEDKSILVIALDVSSSMLQSDIQPSRLLRAKQKINELLELRGDSNTALIAYSGSAHTVMPTTKDKEMIKHFLDALTPNLMPIQGKLPQKILPIAQKLLLASDVPGTLLVIGDGATEETTDMFAEFFMVQPHQLIVWGVGKTPSQISSDSNIIPLQLAQLNDLADQSNGRIVELSIDDEDVKQVNRYIENNLVIVEDAARPWLDAGYPIVFLIGAMFLFWFRRGWTLQW